MPFAAGFRLGPYEIVAPIGAGGMGEVYRARDTRLGRDVAVKVLPQHFSGDPGRRERFEREARVISNLNHPHICTLFDIGSQETPQGPVAFLVMEHIEGETLASRLAKGAPPIDQVLRTAVEIADALDRAHRQGVIHRDLKPANVMLTRSGAKLLDFGLAKLTEGRGAASGPGGGPGGPAPGAGPGGASDRAFAEGSLLATATRDLTTAGSLLGTFQYMAPEQLEGKEADARTDIFAFGVLVYEMATGRKAFEGKSQASLIAAVLKEQPRPMIEWQPLSPPGLERVVRACMEKDPDERVQTAHDVKMQLGWVVDGSLSGVVSHPAGVSHPGAVSQSGGAVFPGYVSQPGAASRPGGLGVAGSAAPARGPAPWIVAAAFVLFGTATAALGWWMHAAPRAPGLRVNLQLPARTELDSQNASLALSPDGRTLAYSGTGPPDGKQRLWLRALDGLQPVALAGTEGATYPFWSPDGKYLGFFAEEKVKKIPVTGGTAQTLCAAQDGRGATWSAGGQIVFAPVPYGGLQSVSAAGGTPVALTTTQKEGATHRLPHFLPDGRRVMFYANEPGDDAGNGIQVFDPANGKVSLLAPEKSEGRFVAPGYLLFVRDGNLLAQPMDPNNLKLTGEAIPIAEKVQFNPNRWTGAFTFADTGLALYQTGTGIVKRRFTWLDAEGKEQGVVGEPATIVEMSLSPDGKRAAATVVAPSGPANVWVYDLGRGIGSRLTFNADGGSSPIWSPDGRQIAYTDSQNRVFIKAVDGASEPRALIAEPGVNRQLTQWIPDGSGILLTAQNPKTGFDIVFLPAAGGEKPRPVFATAANEGGGRVSPDGHWLTYDSDESGRREQYITAWPNPGGKWQVSPTGGFGGGWTEGGRRILYGDPDGKVMSVDVTTQGGSVTIGAPHPIFGGKVPQGPLDVTQDGKRFLIAQSVEEAGQSTLVLMTDWTAALQK